MNRKALFRFVVGLAVVTTTSSAFADEPTPPPTTEPAPAPATEAEDRAREHYHRGLELYDEGDFRLALVEFERAYSYVAGYKLLFNIGQVHFQLNHYAQARVSLEKYLRDGGDAIAPKRRGDVERDLATLRTRTAILTVHVNVPDAEIRVNDVVMGKAPLDKALVDAGPLKVQVSRSGFPARTRDVTLAGGDEQLVTIELSNSDMPDRPGLEAPRSGTSRATIGWIATGVLAAGAIGTGITALVTSSRYDSDLHAATEGSPEDAKSGLERQRSVVKAFSLATDILAGAAVVAGGVSLYFTLHDRPSSDAPRVRVQGSRVTFEVGF